jgi:membrane associated rhomboid family serine protease
MAEVAIPFNEHALKLDVCRSCQFLWFDPHEFEQLPEKPPEPNSDEDLPQKAREQMAIAEAHSIGERARGDDFGDEPPDEAWKWFPALLGMPVEHEVHPLRSWPWATWALIAVAVLVAVFTHDQIGSVAQEFGMIPAQVGRYGGITFLTSFFLHGGVMHLIGNMYFLLIFGDNVEDHLGKWKYLLLLFVATVVGDCIHILGEPRSMIPAIGASGGISGIIVYYALQFPKARLGFVVRILYMFRWIYIPAWFALVCWLLLQSFGVYQQLAGFSNVSALAHLGGASVGLAAWYFWGRTEADVSSHRA